MSSLLLVFFFLTLTASVHSFKLLPGFKASSLLKVSNLQQSSTMGKALVATTLLTPSIALADDTQNMVIFPLVIAALTMVPYFIYQQALKPKPRKVKQIELDEYLRPIEDSATSKGRESEARAAKRK
eukprot:gene4661-5105_t